MRPADEKDMRNERQCGKAQMFSWTGQGEDMERSRESHRKT